MPGAGDVEELIKKLRELNDVVVASHGANNDIKDVVGGLAPPLTKTEVGGMAKSLADRLAKIDHNSIRSDWVASGLIKNIDYLIASIVPNFWNGNWMAAYSSYRSVLDHIEGIFADLFRFSVDWESVTDRNSLPPELAKRLRSVKAQIKAVENKASNLDDQVSTINDAYEAALNLPTDLAALEEARGQTSNWRDEAQRDAILSADALKTAGGHVDQLSTLRDEARKLVKDTADAYSAATTKGLGQSFQERADRTAQSMWIWVGGLIVALSLSALLGINRVQIVQQMIEQKAPASLTQLHTILAILSIAAPVWFAWIATKQIGQRFRLSEDYAYKAAVARAYEGYRREAARFDDPAFTDRLFKTALDRLDEPPLRYVEQETHGSPLHEWIKARAEARQARREEVDRSRGGNQSPPPSSTATAASNEEEQ